jgi:uncharacterized protein
MGRLARTVIPAVATAGAALVGATGWVVADRMLRPPREVLREGPLPEDVVAIVGTDQRTVTLRGPTADRSGRWGLAWEGGYGQVGDPRPAAGAHTAAAESGAGGDQDPVATRSFLRLSGDRPRAGSSARFDPAAWPEDPSSLGLDWEEVTYRSTAGEVPAWFFPGTATGGTWAIFVHGRAGRRSQAFRLLRVAHGLGMPCLTIAYRNDPDAPLSDDRRCHLGGREWHDVEGAVVTAVARGARDVVLVGYSMGGTAVLTFLRTSAHAERVRGVVLEAPVVRWDPVIRRAIRNHGAPRPFAAATSQVALTVAGLRAGIDWDRLDHVAAARELRHPMLIVHGEDDTDVPIATVEPLADRRRDLIQLVRVPGGEHLTAWNVAPTDVETAVRSFLSDLLEDAGSSVADRARRAVTRFSRAGGRRSPRRR